MSTNEKGVSTAVTAADPVPATVSPYHQMAQQRIAELLGWREEIPRIVIPATSDATRRLISVASVPGPFIELTNVAVANQPVLVRVEGATPAEVRDLLAYADAHGPLADELEALAHFLRHSCAAARNAAGQEALTTYSLAKRMAKLPQYAYLKPYVADMRRALGRGQKLTPEAAAQKAAERAAKAAEKVAKRAAKLLGAAPDANPTTTTKQ